jgi:hypothetical protein
MHDLKPAKFNNTKLSHMELSSITPPKLSLDSLPLHRAEPPGLATPPPFRVPIAIPFVWEEEPGRPRKESILIKPKQKPFSYRSLELPPRMVAEELRMKAGMKHPTSPTSVLDVPCSISRSRSWSRCCSFNTRNERSQSYKGEKNAEKRESSGSSNSLISSSSFDASFCGCDEGKESRVKITRIKRHRSLVDVSVHATSSFLVELRS